MCGDLFEDLKKGGGQLKEKYAARDVIVPFLSALAYLHSQVRALPSRISYSSERCFAGAQQGVAWSEGLRRAVQLRGAAVWVDVRGG